MGKIRGQKWENEYIFLHVPVATRAESVCFVVSAVNRFTQMYDDSSEAVAVKASHAVVAAKAVKKGGKIKFWENTYSAGFL